MSQPNNHPSWVGRTISGRYTIEGILGEGGMSSVYKGTDPNLQRTVAIKLIHPHLSRDPEFVRRFEQEAAAVAQLRHQNIIQVYDFNHDGDIYYMVLEFVPGETLQDKQKILADAGKQLELEDTIKIMATTCDAVAYAHEKGMIHRDLKPANVMINPKEEPILMDFGVAKMLGTSQHTATGAIIGTAKYMSPEQARGDRPDERTDIYSLGVMLYEMVAGTTPFEGESTIAILMKHVTEPLPDVKEAMPDVPPGLVAVIEKALAKDKEDRYHTAADMAVALRAVDLTAPAVAPEPGSDATILHTGPDATIVKAAVASAAVAPAPPSPASAQPEAKKGGVPMWAIAGAVVLVLLLIIGAGAMFAFSGGSDGDETGTSAENGQDEVPVAAVDDPTDTPEPVVEEEPTESPTDTPEPLPTPTEEPEPTEAPAEPEPTEPPAEAEPTESTGDQLPAEEDTPTPEPEAEEPTATPEPEPTEPPAEAEPTEPPAQLPEAAEMSSISAGFFLMGSNSGQANEQPEHPVMLNGYSIDTFEVTNAQYRACVEDGSCTPANTPGSFTRPSYRDDPAFDNYPVVSVSWDQANVYCRWAGKRLPTEAEWEYAAAGPDNFTWPWGNSFDPALSAASSADTQEVGSFPGGASVYGVFELAGNTNEWVADTFDESFYANSPASNPENTAGGDGRIYRGGSFDNPDGSFYTASRRYGNVRSFSEVDVGFRCAADAANAEPSPELVAEFCGVYEAFKPGAPCP